jgi:hypothetical protein
VDLLATGTAKWLDEGGRDPDVYRSAIVGVPASP